MMEFHAREYQNASHLFAAAKERKQRMERAAAMPQRIEALEKALKEAKREKAALKAQAAQLQCVVDRQTDELRAAHNIIDRLKQMVEEDDEMTPFARRHPFQIAQEYLARNHPRVKLADVLSDTRKAHVVEARHGVYRAVKDERDDMAIAAIARRFKRDHTTLLASLKKTEPKGGDE